MHANADESLAADGEQRDIRAARGEYDSALIVDGDVRSRNLEDYTPDEAHQTQVECEYDIACTREHRQVC
jgi:hypothetical protein